MAVVKLLSTRLAREFVHLHDRLHRVLIWMLDNVWPEQKECVITCIYRTEDEEKAIEKKTGKRPSGVHHSLPHRAIDIRTWPLTNGELNTITTRINMRFVYDSSRPKLPVAYSTPHGDGPHLHLQARNETEEKL